MFFLGTNSKENALFEMQSNQENLKNPKEKLDGGGIERKYTIKGKIIEKKGILFKGERKFTSLQTFWTRQLEKGPKIRRFYILKKTRNSLNSMGPFFYRGE